MLRLASEFMKINKITVSGLDQKNNFELLNNLDIIILSDHGSKTSDQTDDLDVFLIHRNSMTEYLINDKKITIQELITSQEFYYK